LITGYTVEEVEGSLQVQKAVKEAQIHLHPEQEPRVFSDSSIRRIEKKIMQIIYQKQTRTP
jgi:hypothetical protein